MILYLFSFVADFFGVEWVGNKDWEIQETDEGKKEQGQEDSWC